MNEAAPIITISREKGSGGKPVAFRVIQKLQKPWQIYDQDTLEQIARENEMTQWFHDQTTTEMRERINKRIKQFFGEKFEQMDPKFQELITLLATIGERGHAIIVGRGAHILFPEALKIRLICALQQRIEWVKEFEHLTTTEAIAVIRESDLRRDDFVRTLYQHELKIPYHYDMIIRTSKDIQLDDAAAAIVHLAERKFGINE